MKQKQIKQFKLYGWGKKVMRCLRGLLVEGELENSMPPLQKEEGIKILQGLMAWNPVQQVWAHCHLSKRSTVDSPKEFDQKL